MRNKAIFCFIILLTLFLSVSVISASENNTCDNLNSVDGDAIEVPSADADLDELSLSDGNLNEVSSADEDFDKVLSSDANLNEVSSADDAVIASDDAKSSTVISAKDKTSYVDYKDKFTVQLTSGGKALANKPVTITLNNVKYNKVTDSNGQATINFKLKTGKYKVKYSFAGDDEFTASSGASKINVK